MGRKTLSGGEMYAHCRNRHEQKHLREKLENLSEEEFVSMDFIKMETNKWRQFRRENRKSSGWSAEAKRQGTKGRELISLNSPPHDYPKARPFKGPLQLPWVYTYNNDSHNQVCKDLLQSSLNYKTSLSLRYQSAKLARLSKMSTSSSAGSSGNESPRTSLHEERKPTRQLRGTKNAWVCSENEWRTGDRCPPNTPKTSLYAKTPPSVENEFLEDRDIVFVTELKPSKKLMTKSFSTNACNQNTKSAWCGQRPHENAMKADMEQTGTSSSSQLRRDMGNMDLPCADCGGKLTGNEVKRSESRGPLDFQSRINSINTDSLNPHQQFHDDMTHSDNINKSKSQLCRSKTEPPSTHCMTSTLTTDTINAHFGRIERHSTNRSLIFPPTKENDWRDNFTLEESEDILESSFPLWELPPHKLPGSKSENESSPFFHHINRGEYLAEEVSILSDFHEQSSSDTSINQQPLDSIGNSKSVLLPKRRQARDETINKVDLIDIQKQWDRDAMTLAHEASTGNAKIDPNEFQLQAHCSPHANHYDFSEKRKRIPTDPHAQMNNQINVPDNPNESIEDNQLITRNRTEHFFPCEDSGTPKEHGNNVNYTNTNDNAVHQKRRKCTNISKDSKTLIAKSDRKEEKRYFRVNPRISSGKNGVLCGLPKVLQKKTQDLRSQRRSATVYKLNTTRCPMEATGHRSETEEGLSRPGSVVKSQQKRPLIEINVRIPQVVKDEIGKRDALIRTQSYSKIEKPFTSSEKAPETNVDAGFKPMEGCDEGNLNVLESSDNRGSNIHTEGIKDPFSFSEDPMHIAGEKEKTNNTDHDNVSAITNDNISNNNDTKDTNVKTKSQNNSHKTLKRSMSAAGRLVSGTDDVYHKGILLSNYVSPEQRYKVTFKGPASSHRLGTGGRHNSFVNSPVTNSNSYVIRLNFSKQARQQALSKLIEDNHSSRGNTIQKALEESLQARIKAFCVSLDPYRQPTFT